MIRVPTLIEHNAGGGLSYKICTIDYSTHEPHPITADQIAGVYKMVNTIGEYIGDYQLSQHHPESATAEPVQLVDMYEIKYDPKKSQYKYPVNRYEVVKNGNIAIGLRLNFLLRNDGDIVRASGE